MPAANGTEVKTEIKKEEDSKQQTGEFKVFVGRLSATITTDDLKNHFKGAGEVSSVSIPWKVVKENKRHGMGFVDFAKKEGFEAALKMDQSLLDGHPIMVLPASRTHEGLMIMEQETDANVEEKDKEKDGENDKEAKGEDKEKEKEKETGEKDKVKENEKEGYVPVYKKSEFVACVKNIPNGASDEDVLNFFEMKKEDIVDMIVLHRQNSFSLKAKRRGKRPVRAIIAFKTAEDLEKALAKSKNKINDQEVIVDKYVIIPRPEKRTAEDGGTGGTGGKQARTSEELDMFVKNIPRDAVERQIRDFFASAGAVVHQVGLFTDNISGVNRGMGFITMKNKESVQKALLLDNKRFFKNKVRVSIRRDKDNKTEKAPIEPSYSTFISNLSVKEKPEAVKQVLNEYFKKKECKVKSVRVPFAPNRSGNRGYAFIVFEDEASLKKCHAMGNSQVFISGNKNTITATDRWPESPSDSAEWAKQQQERFGGMNRSRRVDFPKAGYYGPSPFGPAGPPIGPVGPMRDDSFRSPFIMPHEPGFRGEVPLDYQNTKDYQDYLDFLEYRDYVAMRNAVAEQRETDFRRFRDGDDFSSGGLARQLQSERPMTDTGTGMDSTYAGRLPPRKEETFRAADSYREFTGPVRVENERRIEDPRDFDNSVSIGSRRDLRDYPEFASRHADREGFSGDRMSAQGSGAFGAGNSGGRAALEQQRRESDGYGGGRFPDSFASAGSDRYQTANESTLTRSQLLDSSSAGFRRETVDSGAFREQGRGDTRSYNQSAFAGGASADGRRQSDRDSKYGLVGYPERSSSGYTGDKSGFAAGFGSGFGVGSGSRAFLETADRGGDISRFSAFGSGVGVGGGGGGGGDRRFGASAALDKPNLGMNSKGGMSSNYNRKY